MGLHWGRARANNKQGHLIGHIKDIGQDPDKPETRLYATSAAQVGADGGLPAACFLLPASAPATQEKLQPEGCCGLGVPGSTSQPAAC
jgi:hypothetical protein